MALDFPSTSLNTGQIYEGWAWNGSAWRFVGSAVGSAAITTTTTTSILPTVQLVSIAQNDDYSLATFGGLVTSQGATGLTDWGIYYTDNSGYLPETPEYPNSGSGYYSYGTYSGGGDPIVPPGFTIPDLSTGFGTLAYYRAYAVNSNGISYSAEYPWVHIQSSMTSLSPSGGDLEAIETISFGGGFGGSVAAAITEAGFLWHTDKYTRPTYATKTGIVSVTPPSAGQPSMTAKLTGLASSSVNVRAYYRFGTFFCYSLDSLTNNL
jgi:hypothetical protein